MTAEETAEWEPGDPLYDPSGYSNYFFNFRNIEESVDCFCPDRASWPEPAFASHRLPTEQSFIDKWKAELGLTDG